MGPLPGLTPVLKLHGDNAEPCGAIPHYHGSREHKGNVAQPSIRQRRACVCVIVHCVYPCYVGSSLALDLPTK